jgi:two-component system LytT family response regulator
MKIRALIAEDEPLARDIFRELLQAHSDVDILAEATTTEELVDCMDCLKPDLVFLDIRMPGGNSLETVLQLERSESPIFIVVTAFDQYAMKAFEAHAIDYLLKPVSAEKLAGALDRARTWMRKGTYASEAAPRVKETIIGLLGKIVVRADGRVFIVDPRDIEYVEADGNYIHIHSHAGKHMVRQTMREFEESTRRTKLIRIHRSTMVNIDAIREMRPSYTGDYDVILKSGKELTLSRKYRDFVLGKSAYPDALAQRS